MEILFAGCYMIILDPAKNRSMILEMEHALAEAKSQIIKKKYGSTLIYEGYTTRLQYGLAFYDNQVLIAAM